MKNIISRAVDQMVADSVAVWLVAENTDSWLKSYSLNEITDIVIFGVRSENSDRKNVTSNER